MSFGGVEGSGIDQFTEAEEAAYDPDFIQQGVTFVASNGGQRLAWGISGLFAQRVGGRRIEPDAGPRRRLRG